MFTAYNTTIQKQIIMIRSILRYILHMLLHGLGGLHHNSNYTKIIYRYMSLCIKTINMF